MPRNTLPIFNKVSNNLLRAPILFIAKIKKPIIPKLIFLKKTRKLKRFRVYKHKYNHGLFEEFEFSPSSTPLIGYKKHKYLKNASSSMLFMCACLGGFKAEKTRDMNRRLSLEAALPCANIGGEYFEPLDLAGHDEDSVDQRADKFIEWFYQEMRLQRQESN